jgi:hypothetical protein
MWLDDDVQKHSSAQSMTRARRACTSLSTLRSMQTFSTHPSVSTFDRFPFQLMTDERKIHKKSQGGRPKG